MRDFSVRSQLGLLMALVSCCLSGCPTSQPNPIAPRATDSATSTSIKTEPESVIAPKAESSLREAHTDQPSLPQSVEVSTTQDPALKSEALPTFVTLGEESGLDFQREDDIRGQRRIFESTGGGVAMIDLDNDGWLDLIFTGGCRMPQELSAQKPTCGVYRSELGTHFHASTAQSRLSQGGYCQGITVGDYDNDGFDDLFISAFGRCGLWHNCGDGTFEDVTASCGLTVDTWATSCAFSDLNLDGNLDLYVVTYLKESAQSPLRCPNNRSPDGFEQCPPSKFEGLPDILLLNDGQGQFSDISASVPLGQLKGKGLGVVVSDFDRDGRPDVYVGNDGEPNHLFKNETGSDSKLILRECAMLSGVALTEAGFAQASMGIAAGDYDNNGTTDLLVTNFAGDSDTFYKNGGNLQFEDITRRTGLSGPSRPVLGWGTVFADFNNDNRLDLAVVNGHVDDRRWQGQGEKYRMPNQLYLQGENSKFVDHSRMAGDFFAGEWMARGLACGDLNRDGRLDLAVSHQLDKSIGLSNQTAVATKLTTLKFAGTKSNRNGIGVQVELFTPDGTLVAYRELCGGASYQSANAPEIYLSVKDNETLRVTWPSGRVWKGDLSHATSVLIREGLESWPKP